MATRSSSGVSIASADPSRTFVALINELRDRGVEFVSLTEAIDTTTPMGSLIMIRRESLTETPE